MKTKVIMSRRMADYLILNGNELLYTLDSNKIKGYVVFVFKDTDKLREDMSNYKK